MFGNVAADALASGAAVIGLLYSALLLMQLIGNTYQATSNWLRARRLRPKLLKSDFVLIPTVDEMQKYGSPAAPTPPRGPWILFTFPPLHVSRYRVGNVILLFVLMFLTFAARLIYLGLSAPA